jgi:hypothetical protein
MLERTFPGFLEVIGLFEALHLLWGWSVFESSCWFYSQKYEPLSQPFASVADSARKIIEGDDVSANDEVSLFLM